ncbi:MAG: 2OG-Fe(II) oxygenase [Pseudomonadales bacterium]|nr:2OG-Fe(II) oxygenase [Pseudomonadales bacterium]MDP4641424.1 2OG-Fe(II) oxygenase [Pseudomonadales bacterium]
MLNFQGRLLSPAIDQAGAAHELATSGAVLIPRFLEQFAADETFACLNEQVSWEMAYRNGPESMTKTVAQLSAMTPEDRQAFHGAVIEQARRDYQFAYFRYPMIDAYTNKWQPALMLNAILEAINSAAVVEFLQKLTGDEQIRKVELQATYYAPGHFLKLHNDSATTGDDRRYACVINLSKDWESHWGGLLQFVDNGGVTATHVPTFNSCSLFKVPRDHQVSYVAPFATRPRYALTGWLRAD